MNQFFVPEAGNVAPGEIVSDCAIPACDPWFVIRSTWYTMNRVTVALFVVWIPLLPPYFVVAFDIPADLLIDGAFIAVEAPSHAAKNTNVPAKFAGNVITPALETVNPIESNVAVILFNGSKSVYVVPLYMALGIPPEMLTTGSCGLNSSISYVTHNSPSDTAVACPCVAICNVPIS